MTLPINELKIAYEEAKRPNGLIALTQQLRAKNGLNSLQKEKVLSLFRSMPLWIEVKTRSGHAHFKHKLTGISIGFQSHGESTIKKKQAQCILENVQSHLNFLGNDIFQYTKYNWKKEPDYNQSAKRLSRRYQKHS